MEEIVRNADGDKVTPHGTRVIERPTSVSTLFDWALARITALEARVETLEKPVVIPATIEE